MTRTSPTEPAASLAPSAVSTAVVTLQADMPPSVRHTLAHCTRGTYTHLHRATTGCHCTPRFYALCVPLLTHWRNARSNTSPPYHADLRGLGPH